MIPFEALLDRPSGKEWPEVDIDYNSLQHPRNARKLLEDDLVAQWSKECWGSFYSEKDNCIEFSDSFNLFPYEAHSRKMYIFDEYRYALRCIVAAWENNAGGVVLGGHPGIGKSSLLPAVLRYFLRHERPIVYHVSGTTFLFTPKGVYEIVSHNVTLFNRLHYRGMFALIDSGDDELQPPPILVDHRSRLFVVHAASPNPDRYKSWLKHKRGLMVIMNPPRFDEAYKMLLLHAANEEVESRKSMLKLVFEEYNPSVRVLLQILEQNANIDWFIQCVHDAVDTLTPDKLDSLVRQGPTNTSEGISYSLVTSFRSLIVPDDVYQQLITTMSPIPPMYSPSMGQGMYHQITSLSIWRLIMGVYQNRDLETRRKLHNLFRYSSRHTNTLSRLFEMMSIDLLSAEGEFVLQPVNVSQELTIKFSNKLINIFDAKSKADTTIADQFHVPSQANNATWDAFSYIAVEAEPGLGRKVGIGYQMTVGRKHSVKSEGIRVLYDRMKAADVAEFWFVFVIPKGQKDFKAPQVNDTRFRVFTLEVDFRDAVFDMESFCNYTKIDKEQEEVYEMDIH